jgi:hypothetical protein
MDALGCEGHLVGWRGKRATCIRARMRSELHIRMGTCSLLDLLIHSYHRKLKVFLV